MKSKLNGAIAAGFEFLSTLIEDRLSVLQHVVNFWHGPIRPEDGMSAAELAGSSLPAALRW